MNSANLREIYRQIGPAGVVLIAVSLLAVFLALKNLFLLHFINKDFRKRFDSIENGERPYSAELHAPENPLIAIISQVVATHAAHSDDLRAEIAYLFHRHFSSINRDITWLKLISVASPLLGLLGTMLGMVTVFRELSSGMANPALLAGGIMEALNTTIMGLTIALPTLVAYYSLSLKMRGFHIEAIEHSYRAIERFKRNCPAAQSNPPASGAQPHAAHNAGQARAGA